MAPGRVRYRRLVARSRQTTQLVWVPYPTDDLGAAVGGWLDEERTDESAGLGVDEDAGAVVEGGDLDATCDCEPGHDVSEEAGDPVGTADGVAGGGLDVGAAVDDEFGVGDEGFEEGLEIAASTCSAEAAHDFVASCELD